MPLLVNGSAHVEIDTVPTLNVCAQTRAVPRENKAGTADPSTSRDLYYWVINGDTTHMRAREKGSTRVWEALHPEGRRTGPCVY